MVETKTYDFNWQFPKPMVVATLLDGERMTDFLSEYNGRVDRDFNGNKNLKVYSLIDGVITGSNPFAVVLTNQIFGSQGIRTATPSDIARIIEGEIINLRRNYVDHSLVLRTQKDSYNPNNDSLIAYLGNQLASRGLEFSADVPLIIPLNGLELELADNSYGLTFKLREDAKIYEAPVLSNKNNGKRFSRADENGIPILDGAGDKVVYTRDDGLSRACSDGGLVFVADRLHLAFSVSDGRVVLVQDAPQKLFGK